MTAIAWVLNFEADRELGSPGYTAPLSVRRRTADLPDLLRRAGLVRAGDLVVDAETPPGSARGRVGRAWCPTPTALALLARAGATVPEFPPLAILRSVNSRRFSAALGQTLPEARFVDDLDALAEAVAEAPPAWTSGSWCLKTAFGASGSGQRLVTPGRLDAATRTWAARALGHGLQVEPRVRRELDLALHGYVARDGEVTLGRPTLQHLTEAGSWRESMLAVDGDLTAAEAETLRAEGERTGRALATAGYFGPFNLDGFRYAYGSSARLNPRCEVNARYTMGWATGLGGARPDLDPEVDRAPTTELDAE